MKNLRKFVIITMLAAAVFSGCAKKEVGGNGGKRLIGFTAMDLTDPFFIVLREAMKTEIEARGDTLVTVDGKLNQAAQNDAIEDLITQGISALILCPVDSKSVQPALEACKKANIPVINVDSRVDDTGLVTTFISSSNFTAGYQCGAEIVKLYPDGAKICIIENPLAESIRSRVEGLQDAIAGSKSAIVDRKSVNTYDVVLRTAEDMLQANPDIDVFWGLNDAVSLIILGAIEAAGRTGNIRVLSVDGTPSGKTSVANGAMYATAMTTAKGMSDKTVECVYTLLSGGSMEKEYFLDTILVTPENVNSFSLTDWN